MYGKTFTSLWEGSMVGQADAQLVFIFLFCHCDHEGFVEAHPAGIAAKTGIPLDRVENTIDLLESPDPKSRSKEEEGRRIIPLDGDHVSGWKVVNYKYYRDLRRQEDRREYQRQYWHKRKAGQQKSTYSTLLNPTSTPTQPYSTEVDVEVEVEAKKKRDTVPAARSRFSPPSLDEVKTYCMERRNRVDPAQWIDHYESNGWKVGRNPMKSWKAAVRTWERLDMGGAVKAAPAAQEKPRNLFLEKMERLRKLHEGGE